MENTETKPKTGIRQIVNIAIVLIVLIGIVSAVLYTQKDKMQSYPALKMTVTTALNESTELPIVTNVTMEQTTIPFYYRRADTPPKFPEITVETKIGAMMSPPVGYRAGTYRPEEGRYELTVTFRDGMEPKPGDLLIMAIRLSDFKGAIVKKTTAFYEWK